MRQRRTVIPYRRKIGKSGRVNDGDRRAAVLQTIGQRIRSEQHRHWHGNGAELVAGKMADGDFRTLRQHNGHARAAHDAGFAQHISQAIGSALETGIGDDLVAVDSVIVINGHARRIGCPARAAMRSDIEVLRYLPAEFLIKAAVLVSGCR